MSRPNSPADGGDRPERFLDRFKEFGPTSFAVGHRISVLVLLALITVMGVVAYRAIPKESSPEIVIPVIAVNTVYPGVSPADMESLVTRPIEEELGTISNIDELTSTSVEGYSSITAEFSTSVDLNEALQQVREKVDLARPELPEEAEDPSIVEFDLSELPVLQVNVSGEYGLVRLKEVGEELQDRLESIPSVLRVQLRGGLERVVKVDVDLPRLKNYELSLGDVIDAIRNENVNFPGGSIDVGEQSYLVRVDGEFEDPSIIEDLVVAMEDGRPIYVRDLASVEFGFADRASFARLDGTPVVTLDVVKRSGENIIETSESVKEVIAGAESVFPPTTQVSITSDQSEDIHQMVSSLENNIIAGLVLIVAILFFFLGLRTSVFVALAIPTSMLLSFLVLAVLGVTMNMVVLFSLILALGMLVDNAIVVVENIYRYVQDGWDRISAARKATGEVAMPVVAATLTTLAAFAPLLFWPGVTGEFMKFLPITLIVTLSSSLFVAMVILPTLCAVFIRPEATAGAGEEREGRTLTPAALWTAVAVTVVGLGVMAAVNWLTALLLVVTAGALWLLHRAVLARLADRFQFRTLPRLTAWYERRLRSSLNHRGAILAGSGAAFIASLVAFGFFNHGVEFFPEDRPPSQILVDIETSVGSRVESTDSVAERLEEELAGLQGREDAESVVTTVGGGGGGFMGGPSGADAGRITLSLVDYQDRSRDAFVTLAEMQERLGTEIAGADISVEGPQGGPPSGAAVNIELVGEDPEVLEELSARATEILENDPVGRKLIGLESDLAEGRPELSVRVDRERAALYDLSTAEVGRAVRGAVQGIEAAEYRTGSDEYDIVVRLAERYREELSSLEDLTVMADGGAQIPLVAVAEWDVGEGYGSIRRKDQDRVATLSAEVGAGLNSNAVLAEVQETLAGFRARELPPGYTMRYTGQQEDQQEAQGFLGTAFLIALALMGFILISQFNSVVKPVIILTSVVMSTVGVLLGLIVFRMPFVIIMTGVGVISLAGIVVNNGIVLIDYIDILRNRDSMDLREALIAGGVTRFRPVVLTAITTALGLVPLAIGLNFDFFGLYSSLAPDLYWGGEQAAWWGPMAIAVIVGIIFATFLTLILVPVMYSLVEDALGFFRRHFTRGGEREGTAGREVREPEEPGREPSPAPVGAPSAPGEGTRPEEREVPAEVR